MSQVQQQQKEQPTLQLREQPGPLVIQSSETVAQLSRVQYQAQIPTGLSVGKQVQAPSALRKVPLQVKPSAPLAQFLPLQPQMQTNQVTMNSIPNAWETIANSPANYNIPCISNWVPGQGVIPQSSGVNPFPASGVFQPNNQATVTSHNAVVAISPKSACIPSATVNHVILPDDRHDHMKGKSSVKRKMSSFEVSPETRAKYNRERNKEHARSTRLRKKAYVQRLKEMAGGLRAIQTEEIRQRRMAVQKMTGVQKARRIMIQTMLHYHSSYESDPLKWEAISEDSCRFKQPVTPFRSFRRSEVEKDCRVLRGIDAMICDSASMSVMIERIGCRNARWKQIKREKEREISCQYAINEDDMIMTDDILMCPFVFRSKNAVLCGALSDCVMPGMLTANFSKANKIQNLEIVFDAMGFMQQLDSANGCEVEAQVIPGSLEVALMACPSEARVITEAKPPFSIIHVNEAWTKLTKYSQLEVEGKGLFSLIQGTNTNLNAGLREGKPVHKFEEVAKGRPACSTSIHYDKFGNSFADFMSSYPLTNVSDEISHLLHVSQELPQMKVLI